MRRRLPTYLARPADSFYRYYSPLSSTWSRLLEILDDYHRVDHSVRLLGKHVLRP